MQTNDQAGSRIAALEHAGWKRLRCGNFMDGVGPLWALRSNEEWRYGMLAHDGHLNPAGVVHGGALQTLIDHVLSIVAWKTSARMAGATVQTDTQFLAAVRSGAFIEAFADEAHRTRNLMFLRGRLEVDGKPVLGAQAIFKLSKAPAASEQ
jgi:uncharacterized protein (TIGR00369 family)